jgi:hypothetical protein
MATPNAQYQLCHSLQYLMFVDQYFHYWLSWIDLRSRLEFTLFTLE